MTLTATERTENAIAMNREINDGHPDRQIAALEKIARELANELDQTVNFCADI